MRSVRASILLTAMAGILAACGNSISDRAARDEVTQVSKDDPAMLNAFDYARQTLAEHPVATFTGFAVKVRMSEGDQVEYFWVTRFSHSGSAFTGTLANDGESLRKYRAGQSIKFSEVDIVDWLYHDDTTGAMKGNFTACALLTHEDPKEAAEFKKEHGLECNGF
jgi:uncharacterized protein YegJ (DUF2314 family)